MREWTREEKYRYLKDPRELEDLYRKVSASVWLHHLRIFTDASSIEIFVNDGDAVFTSRVFPTEEERWFSMAGDVFFRIWTVRPAVRDSFLI